MARTSSPVSSSAWSDFLLESTASILARAVFVERLAALGREFGLELPKGASSRVDAAGAEFLKKHGMKKLGQAAKLHFRTTQKIQAKPGQAKPGQTRPGQAKPSQAKARQAKKDVN